MADELPPSALPTDDVPGGVAPPTLDEQLAYLAEHGRLDDDD